MGRGPTGDYLYNGRQPTLGMKAFVSGNPIGLHITGIKCVRALFGKVLVGRKAKKVEKSARELGNDSGRGGAPVWPKKAQQCREPACLRFLQCSVT